MVQTELSEPKENMFWETREGRKATIILHMKKRKLELFNKASTQPCSLLGKGQRKVG